MGGTTIGVAFVENGKAKIGNARLILQANVAIAGAARAAIGKRGLSHHRTKRIARDGRRHSTSCICAERGRARNGADRARGRDRPRCSLRSRPRKLVCRLRELPPPRRGQGAVSARGSAATRRPFRGTGARKSRRGRTCPNDESVTAEQILALLDGIAPFAIWRRSGTTSGLLVGKSGMTQVETRALHAGFKRRRRLTRRKGNRRGADHYASSGHCSARRKQSLREDDRGGKTPVRADSRRNCADRNAHELSIIAHPGVNDALASAFGTSRRAPVSVRNVRGRI